MTEPIFKAPLPPQGSGFTPPPAQEQNTEPAGKPQNVKQKLLPYLWYILGGTFFVGLILGISVSGGGETAQPAPRCPLNIVKNPDIQKSFPLCGQTSKTNECVLFIMNTTRYDVYARDFFPDAERLTERQRILISTDNPIYSNRIIPPGWFAQIKIPGKN